ncbi:MAG: iron-sulfur cluster assembly scaffold protein [Planctomycetia bacterium]|nr:iron-sulfur cluster assembly scaffold protein [Planctomycetia bacterium]
MSWQYSEKTKQLFLDAVQGKSGAHVGEISEADGVGEHGSVACGDALKFSFRVERNADDPLKDKIVEARFLTFGCTSAIAASEALCRIIEERSLTPLEALKITNQDIVEYLEGLPTQKIHCSVMGAEALEAAVFDWASKRNVDMEALGYKRLVTEENEGRLVCSCFGITEPYLRRKIRELNLHTVEEVTGAIKAGGACGTCRGEIQDIITEIWSGSCGSEEGSSCSFDPVAEQIATSCSFEPKSASAPVTSAPVQESSKSAASGFVPLATVSIAANGDVVQDPSYKTAEDVSSLTQEYQNASPYQRMKLIEKVIEEEVRPILRRDGGDIEIVDVKDNLIYISMTGACDSCDSATETIELIVKTLLQDKLDPKLDVIEL